MRKRILGTVVALALSMSTSAHAQMFKDFENMIFMPPAGSLCTTSTLQTPPPGRAFCIDSSGVYPWVTSAFVAPSGQRLTSPVISGVNSTVQNKSAYQVLTSTAAATAVNAALGDSCFEALTENTTVGAPANPVDGQVLTFKFTNTASNRTVAWNAVFHFVGSSAPTITVGVKDSIVAFKFDATATVWNELYRALNE